MHERPTGDRPTGDPIRTGLPDDAVLEVALLDLGGTLVVPRTPDIASAVRARLMAETAGRRRRPTASGRWPRPSWRLAVLLALLALIVAAGIAVALGFGLPGLRFFFVGSGSTPAPALTAAAPLPSSATPATSPPATPGSVDLGSPTTLPQARAAVSFRVYVPDSSLIGGASPRVYLDERVIDGEVTLVYPFRTGEAAPPSPVVGPDGKPIGLLVTESRGSVDRPLLGKVIGPGTAIEPVAVNGLLGYWIHGAPHDLVVLGPDGQVRMEPLRQVGDVLVWAQQGTLLRIESPLGLSDTLAIAESMR